MFPENFFLITNGDLFLHCRNVTDELFLKCFRNVALTLKV